MKPYFDEALGDTAVIPIRSFGGRTIEPYVEKQR